MKKQGGAEPKNWPSALLYLPQPKHSKELTQDQLRSLRKKPDSDSIVTLLTKNSRGPSSAVKITPIREPSHPACGQAGLFALRDFEYGQLIILYVGELYSNMSLTDSAKHAGSDYDLWVDRDAGISTDASQAGNEARFINDFRGVASRPNAEFREVWDADRQEKGIAVFVLPERKDKKGGTKSKFGVRRGEEILVSYGKGFWAARSNTA